MLLNGATSEADTMLQSLRLAGFKAFIFEANGSGTFWTSVYHSA